MTKRVKANGWLLGLGAGLVWFVGELFGHPGQRLADANGPVYTITASFVTGSLNSRMLVSQSWPDVTRPGSGWAASGQSLARLVPAIRRSFRRNTYPDAVLHGNAALVPVGWAYIELRNATDQPQQLVLSMPQYRCNQATLFVESLPVAGRLAPTTDSVGTLRNNTPLDERFFPYLQYAFPISLPPRALVPVLLRTESHVGYHEVDVRLWRRGTYVETAFTDSLRDGLQVLVCLLIGGVALVVGLAAANRLLLGYGGYLCSLALAFSCQFGYLNFWDYPAELSINAATVGTLGRLLINSTIHPFLYAVVRPALRHPRRYTQWAAVLCLANVLLIGLHLIPFRLYGHVNYGINLGMVSLTMVSLGWIVYYAVLAYRRERIWSLLLVCVVALAPLLLSQAFALVQAPAWEGFFRQPALHPLLIILCLSYLTFEQFRKELVTRQRMQTQVREVAEHNDTLRREEIESIGRELHDQVGNTLATALGYLGRTPLNPDKLRSIIISAIGELRFLSHNLVKDDDRPLTDKVDTLVSRFNDFAPIRLFFTDYTYQQINQLAVLKQQNLYRIIQELLTNVIRHSGATQASVQFFYDGTTVDVSVEDDGRGFDVALAQTKGIGIQTIYKRATLSGISVQFDATPTGTSVLLQTTLTTTHSDANPDRSY